VGAGADALVVGQWSVAKLLLVAASAIAVGVAVAGWRERDLPGGAPLGVLMLLVAVWCASYAGELAAVDATLRFRFVRLTRVVIAFVPAVWLVFALEYTGRDPKLTTPAGAALLVVPTITAALATVAHPALVAPATDAGTAFVRGPWFAVHAAHSYLLLLGGTTLFVLRHAVSTDHTIRTRVVLAAVAVPWVANVVHLSGLLPLTFDPTPFSLVVTGTLFAVALSEWRLLDALPVAREVARDAVIETMDDGVIVLSDDDRVLDANPAAERILDGCRVGTPLARQTAFDGHLDDLPAEVDLTRDGERRRYELRESTFEHGHGLVEGRLLTIHDVTSAYRRRQRLAVLNRILRHDLRNDLNVVHGYAELLDDDPAVCTRSPAIIREKASRLVDLATKVREAERTLGRDEQAVTDVDVAALVRDRVDDARRERPFVEFDLDVPPTPVVVRASDLLGVAVDNLLENAVVHTDSLTPNVSVGVHHEGETVAVVVSDDGPGIPQQERQVLTDGCETPLEHGSGVGLWLVNWIVSESAGTVSFGANDPVGSVVTVRLSSTSAEGPAS
jgi:signal transduction histidine kinase